ncbi:hypothetical protein LTR85_012270 [Meristemomyces frigidus]|nr:hypothetical protein LTR85_012270 [Meristemomyces frigidus]
MSIVKSLASLLAGKIEVTSQLSRGSEFKVSIPMAAGKIAQHVPGAPATAQNLTDLRSRNLIVVIHGLEHATAHSLRAYLVNWFNCAVVALGDKGPHPDIILADGTDNDKFEELQTQLKAYDQRLAMLTVSAGPPKRASSKYFSEKRIWEGMSRPFGPYKLAKALMRCLERLQHLNQSEMETNVEGQQQKALSMKSSRSRMAIATSHSAAPISLSREHGSESRERQISDSVRPPHGPTGRISPSPSDVSQSNGDATPVVKNRPSILLVEDNKINLKLLETFIAKRGYTNVDSAADGLQAVQAAERRAEGFDIIITDISMPVMDGFEASRKIRELERTRHVNSGPSLTSHKPALLVALTGLASANNREEALRSGVDVFVTKPVRLEELGELLARWERGEVLGGSDTEAVPRTRGS